MPQDIHTALSTSRMIKSQAGGFRAMVIHWLPRHKAYGPRGREYTLSVHETTPGDHEPMREVVNFLTLAQLVAILDRAPVVFEDWAPVVAVDAEIALPLAA